MKESALFVSACANCGSVVHVFGALRDELANKGWHYHHDIRADDLGKKALVALVKKERRAGRRVYEIGDWGGKTLAVFSREKSLEYANV